MGVGGSFLLIAHGVAHSLSDRLADGLGKPRGGGACCEPARFDQQNASLQPGPCSQLPHQGQRHPRGFASARWRLKDQGPSPVQPRTKLGQQRIDRENTQR